MPADTGPCPPGEKRASRWLRHGLRLFALLLESLLLLHFTRTFAPRLPAPHAAQLPEVCGPSAGAPREFGRAAHWGVITTILELNPAVTRFLDCWPGARIVVVGDCKTDHAHWRSKESERLIYLSPGEQAMLGYRISQELPWNHFGRKNLGFLFAIRHGATMIFDFDDDNHLAACGKGSVFAGLTGGKSFPVEAVRTRRHAFNPYMAFKASNGLAEASWRAQLIWPRGFPLAWIKEPATYEEDGKVRVPAVAPGKVAVYQSLADHDPDVDAIYRMTRPLPVTFKKREGKGRVLPPGSFAPWNAQAALLRREAFWGMLLPTTVHGRVSDIWRSYVTTRLMWAAGLHVAFTPAFVVQYRNPHSYMKDFRDERDLYDKADELLQALGGWDARRYENGQLPFALRDVVALMVEKGFLGAADLRLAEAWIADLTEAGYEWPQLLPRERRGISFRYEKPKVVDGRKDGQLPPVP